MIRTFRAVMMVGLLGVAMPGFAQQPATETAKSTTTAPTTATAAPAETSSAAAAEPAEGAELYDAATVQRELQEVLRRHPDEVGRVLKLDPSLFRNEQWMSTYPMLRDFVALHPEVAQNPSYYLQHIWTERELTPAEREARMASQMIESIMIGITMMVVTFVLLWLIRTILEHRRWSRTTRVQTEIQNKLLDRFTTHEELLRYVQGGAGKELLQAALPTAMPQLATPNGGSLSRILWPAQIGVVLFAIGVGLALVSVAVGDGDGAILALGIIVLCAGLGAIASGLMGWLISRRLGALPETAETHAITSRTLTE